MTKKVKNETVASGRRKTAVACVRLRKGSGKIMVNGREFNIYFPGKLQQRAVIAPIDEVEAYGQHDLIIRVEGGGIQAQAEAIRLGLARALVKEDVNRRAKLKTLGFLRRDARKKERKKYGLKKARKSGQYSKR